MINGTSMASPQVAGVIAQHLQVRPNASPNEIKTKISDEAKTVMFTTGLDTDYSTFSTSLLGSPNKILYSKYGTQPTITSGSFSISGALTISSS